MAKSQKLKCIAHAHVEGEVIKSGKVDTYDEPLATRLLTSTRFVVVTEDDSEETPTKPKNVADFKAALDELGVTYEPDAKKDDLVALYEEATAEE